MRKLILMAWLVLLADSLHAQFNETIRTGRPGQSIGAFTVGHGIFQVQSGLDYFTTSGNGLSATGFLSNTVMRFGLTEPFEVSALIEFKTEDINSTKIKGISALDIGMRYHIYSGEGLVPNIGFQVRWKLPNLGGDYEIDQFAPRFILVTSQKFSEKILFITNLGATWNGENAIPLGTYTANLSYSFTDRFGVFIETYGNVLSGQWNIYLNGGIAYLVTKDLQLDISTGGGKNHELDEFFISTGISWRTKRRQMQ